jgi:exodeoxyribonuclease VII small subunit
MAEANTPEISELGFDQVVERLQAVVGKLEQGNLGLEEALKAYEEGVTLARRGHEVLDSAEKRVELLVRRGRDGEVTEPLDPEAAEEDGTGERNGSR